MTHDGNMNMKYNGKTTVLPNIRLEIENISVCVFMITGLQSDSLFICT